MFNQPEKIAMDVCPKCNAKLEAQADGKGPVTCASCGYVVSGAQLDAPTGDYVGSFQKPVPISPSEVERILNFDGDEETPEVKIDLEEGDRVKIKEGRFESFDGTVDEVFPTKGQVRVVVTIYGRACPVDLEHSQVKKI